MPLTSAERSKLWRERKKNNPEEYRAYLQKEKERYNKRKEKGEIKSIQELSAREQRKQRKSWRVNQRNKREKGKILLDAVERLNTPPNSPNENNANNQALRRNNVGRKKVRRDRARAYREIEKMKVKLNSIEKRAEKYKKRLQRMNNKAEAKTTDSPRSKTERLLKNQTVNDNVRKTLVFHHTMIKSIAEKYKNTKSLKHRQFISKVVSSKLLKKYRLKKFAFRHLPFDRNRTHSNLDSGLDFRRRVQRNRCVERLQEKVKVFLERDDNSRATAGKKETVTRNKIKKQKRFLGDSMVNLHNKFKAENPASCISYSFFCKLKPFWILKPTEKSRDTCLCVKCENIHYQIDKLKELRVLFTQDVSQLVATICCNDDQKCAYRECQQCSQKKVPLQDHDPGQQVKWKKWITRRVERPNKKESSEDKTTTVSMTLREEQQCSLSALIDDFQEQIAKIARHLFNIKHQYKALRTLRENSKDSEVVIHIDFSENYNCKYDKEIQSVHFGASQIQITLHTGLVYHGNDVLFSFCSVSDFNKHGPSAIWAHLKPILQQVHQKIPSIETVHFVSDGPTTQYRCKQNFYLFSTQLLETFHFKSGSWNFLEAGHGKGPADGIGGAIKRAADAFVANGGSITNAKSLMSAISEKTKVKMFEIQESDITIIEKEIPSNLSVVPGTMKIHQVLTSKSRLIQSRILSCFCSVGPCSCFNLTSMEFRPLYAEDERIPEPGLQLESNAADESQVGQWCVVKYDGLPYPGIIQNVEVNDIEVKVMHRIGTNRFFWPLLEDVLWYSHGDVVAHIGQPSAVGSRHFQLSRAEWEFVVRSLNL